MSSHKKKPTPHSKIVRFDLHNGSVGRLRYIIKQCIKNKIQLIIYSSMADHLPHTELCEIPAVRTVFQTAFLDSGLLGLYLYQMRTFPILNEYSTKQLIILAGISCGQMIKSDGVNYDSKLDIDQFATLVVESCKTFKKLYGIDVPINDNLRENLMTDFKLYSN